MVLSDAELVKALASFVDESSNPDMANYYGHLITELRAGAANRFVWLAKHIADLARLAPGVKALDVGCGFGVESMALAMVSGATIVANDIRETMTHPINDGVARLRQRGINVNVETLTGDICKSPIAADSFDAIVCNQAIEHVHDLHAMFAVCHRILKHGGRMVITNDNNALHPGRFNESLEYWQKRDRDHAFCDQLRLERPIENADVEPYAVMREKIIRSVSPTLETNAVTKLADATAGLTEAEIRKVAARTPIVYPVPPRLSWSRNPITGEYCERLLEPVDVATELRAVGFHVQVRHGFRKFPLSMLNGVGIAALNRLLFRVRPFFILLATK